MDRCCANCYYACSDRFTRCPDCGADEWIEPGEFQYDEGFGLLEWLLDLLCFWRKRE